MEYQKIEGSRASGLLFFPCHNPNPLPSFPIIIPNSEASASSDIFQPDLRRDYFVIDSGDTIYPAADYQPPFTEPEIAPLAAAYITSGSKFFASHGEIPV